MTGALTLADARAVRMRGQLLQPRDAAPTVLDAVRRAAGLQAQSWPAGLLGVRVRTRGLLAEDVERARVEERSVVRAWFMRGTLHLVPAEDVGWLLGLLGPVFVRAAASRRADLGLDEATYETGVRVLERALANGPLTRAEIAEALVRAGVGIDPKTQALIHLIQRAALEGRVCYGPPGRGEQEIVLLRDWIALGPALPADEAAAELARRYLAAFAPAAPGDYAKWSGLPAGQCRDAFARLGRQLAEVTVDGRPAWMPREALAAWRDDPPKRGVLRLLPAFDTYLLGYADRRAYTAERSMQRIWGGGILPPTLLVDGALAGTWKPERKARETVARVMPFEPLAGALAPALEREAADVGRFLGGEGRLILEQPT